MQRWEQQLFYFIAEDDTFYFKKEHEGGRECQWAPLTSKPEIIDTGRPRVSINRFEIIFLGDGMPPETSYENWVVMLNYKGKFLHYPSCQDVSFSGLTWHGAINKTKYLERQVENGIFDDEICELRNCRPLVIYHWDRR